MARQSFRPAGNDRKFMQKLPDSVDDLPDRVVVDLDNKENPDAYEIIEVDDTPAEDRGKPREWDGPSATEEAELRGLSAKAQKRIDRLVAETQTERRAREARERELDAAAVQLRLQNEELTRLRARIDTGSTALAESMKSERKARLEDAQRRLAQAHTDGDSAAIAKATSDISEATAEMAMITMRTPAPREEVPTQQPQAPTQQVQQRPNLAPNVAAWIARNDSWFNRDPVKTDFAMSVHRAVTARGIRPESDEYTRELDKGLKAMYPEHQPYEQSNGDGRQERSPPRRSNVVAEGSRENVDRSNSRRVELTASQISLAKRMRIPLAVYAAEEAKRRARDEEGNGA